LSGCIWFPDEGGPPESWHNGVAADGAARRR
jgi:hypothetical protein